jgi:DNA end-binding protein Ku
VLRTKQYLALVRPLGDALAVSTLVFADEVIPTEKLEGLPDEDVELSEKELEMARQLIASMESDWEPEKYRDEYRERVLEMIEKKAEGEEIVSVPDDEKEAGDVVDLMAALEASLEKKKSGAAKKTAKKSKKSA